MNPTALLSTPNPGGSSPRQTYSRVAKREDTDYYPTLPPIENVMRATEITPQRLATFAELASKMVQCVEDAVLEASPAGDDCVDTGTPNLHGRNNLAHVIPRHGNEPTVLRAGDDMRSCGRSIYVDSYTNVLYLDVGPHKDYDAHLYTYRPLKDVCEDIVKILERNSLLPLNSPDRIDIWDKYPPGVLNDLEYVSMGRILLHVVYQNGVGIGTRAGNEARPPIKSHTALGSHFVRFMMALRCKEIRGELDTCGIPQADLEWNKDHLARITALGWFDPMDDNERTFLLAKGVLDPSKIEHLQRLTGRNAKGDKLERSLISPVKLSRRKTSYLAEVLLPKYATPSAPARIDRFLLQKLSPPEDETDPIQDIPLNKLISPAFKPSNKTRVAAPINSLPSKSTTKTATVPTAPFVKFAARTIAKTAPISRNPNTLTGSSTLVSSQTASTHAARLPKRNRESDAADDRTTKKGKTIDGAHDSSSPGPFVGSSPNNSSADSPPAADTFKAMLRRSKEGAAKGHRAAVPKGQQAVATRQPSSAPSAAQPKEPQTAAATKPMAVPKMGFAFKMPVTKIAPPSNALRTSASAKPPQAKSMQPAAPSQSVARKTSQPALRPPSTSRIQGPATSVSSAASGGRRVIDKMKRKPQPKSKPPFKA